MLKKLQKIGVSLIVVELIVQLSMPLLSNISVFKQTESIAAEAITGTSDNRFKYTVNDDGTSITITEYIGTDTDVVIPSKIDGYDVTNVGGSSFDRCRSLTNIEIPKGVTSIGYYAFSGCSGLTNIEIPNSVISIGIFAFNGCSSLTSIEIPNSVISIGEEAFYECISLKSIKISEGVTSIGEATFSGCSSLTNIEIPNSVISIGNRAFKRCSSLENIEVDKDNKVYESIEGVLYSKDVKKIIAYPPKKEGTKYKIIEGVTSIGDYAFYGCENLKEVTIASSIKNIEGNSFEESSLTNIKVDNNSEYFKSEDGVLYSKDGTKIICYPPNKSGTKYEVLQGVIDVADFAFYGCEKIKEISLPTGVKNIGDCAFYRCSNATIIDLPSSVETIGIQSFFSCSKLQRIYLENVKNIGHFAFSDCNNLEDVFFPNIEVICSSAFERCSNLENIELPENEKFTGIATDLFRDCSKLKSINIPSNITDIYGGAFSGCNSLTNLLIPDSVTSIGYNAFGEENHTIKCKTNSEIYRYAQNKDNLAIEIDDEAPICNIKYEKFYDENGDLFSIKVTITANEEISKINDWNRSGNKAFYKYFTYNTNEKIIVKDLVGNEVETQISITDFEYGKDGVNVKYYPTELTDEDVVVDIVVNEPIDRVDGWKLLPNNTLRKTFSENTKETVTIKCLSGKEKKVDIVIENIDKYKNILNLTVEKTPSEPTTGNVTVSIKSSRELKDGIYKPRDWDLSDDKKTLTKEFKDNTEEPEIVEITDIYWNTKEVEINVTNIDRQTPEVVNIEYDPQGLTNQDIKVTITLNEPVQKVEGWNLSENDTKLTTTITKNGLYDVKFTDKAGNSWNNNYYFIIDKIDKNPPIVQSINYTPSLEEEINGNVTVEIKFSDIIQEIDGWEIVDSSVLGSTIRKVYTKNTEEPETVIVRDLAGNVSEPIQVNVTNINKMIITDPAKELKADVKYSTKEFTNQNVIVTITANEEIQGIEGWTLSNDNKTLIKTYNANSTENITVKDLAGNSVNVQVSVENIDKIAPTASVIYSTKELTNQNVIVTITANKEIQGVEGWTLSNNNKTLIKTYNANSTENITVKDLAGNSANVQVSVENIDKTEQIVEKAEIITTKYKTDEENKYITNIKAGTTKNDIISNITSNTEYKITTKDDKEVTNETIATGMKVVFTTGEKYEIVVTGDINGDGKISLTDLTKMKRALIGKETIEGCYKEATDVNLDGRITITDLARMKRALVGLTQF